MIIKILLCNIDNRRNSGPRPTPAWSCSWGPNISGQNKKGYAEAIGNTEMGVYLKKILFTSIAWLLDGQAAGLVILVFVLVAKFLRPDLPHSWSTLLVLLAIAFLSKFLGNRLNDKFHAVIVSGSARRKWRLWCTGLILIWCLVYLGLYLYDRRSEIATLSGGELLYGLIWLAFLAGLWIRAVLLLIRGDARLVGKAKQ